MPEETPFRATDQQPGRRLGGATGRGFMPGRSGNPAGRAKGIEALAREHTAAAIATLVAALKDPRHKVAAATALLDRGWGRPKQMIEATGNSALELHLVAARAVSAELFAAIDQPRVIDGRADIDLSSYPPALE